MSLSHGEIEGLLRRVDCPRCDGTGQDADGDDCHTYIFVNVPGFAETLSNLFVRCLLCGALVLPGEATELDHIRYHATIGTALYELLNSGDLSDEIDELQSAIHELQGQAEWAVGQHERTLHD